VDDEKDFFISYTRADRAWAEWIAWQLEAEGYTTIVQAWDFEPGDNFVLAMDAATNQAKRTIAVLSPDYFSSRYVVSEWATAFSRDPKGLQGLLVPVRVRLCDVVGLLGAVIYIDLVGLNETDARSALLVGLQRGRKKPRSTPIFPVFQEGASSRDSQQSIQRDSSVEQRASLPREHVFISYQHQDLDFAKEIKTRIEDAGFKVWIDEHIHAGKDWRAEIDRAISQSFAMILVMTKEAKASVYITYEWAFAYGIGVRLIPLMFRQTKLHPRLDALQYINFTGGMKPWDKLLDEIRSAANLDTHV
jgi:hypothetical protein